MTCFYALKSQTYISLPMIIQSPPLVEHSKRLKTLKQNSESAENRFKQDEIIVNVDKFQSII